MLGRHIGLPLRLLVFFVVFVWANRCVRPCHCIAVVLLGRHAGLPLRLLVFFYRCCRGEPVCSPLSLHCCCFVGQTRWSAPTVAGVFYRSCRGEPVCSPGIALRMHQPYCSGLANPAPTFPLTVKYSHQTLVTADVPSAVIECQRPSTVILTVPTIKHYLCHE